jgi:hypothetical protein
MILVRTNHPCLRVRWHTFIVDRYIQDNFRFMHTMANIIHTRQQACLLLKVDITKAFDSVTWLFLLEVLEFIDFLAIWRDSISSLLSTASMRIILNGVSVDAIHHSRGLRQGDSLSPMLFLMIMEVINTLLHKADGWPPLQGLGMHDITHRAAFYVNNLIQFIRPDALDLLTLREIFNLFEGESGLGCNLTKCQMVPIRCTKEQAHLDVKVFPVRSGCF